MALSDRIVIMKSGRLEQIGSPNELYDFPLSEFVAKFLGRCTLWPVTKDKTRNVFILDGSNVPIYCDVVSNSDNNRVVIRPEYLQLVKGKRHKNALEGIVKEVLTKGSAYQIHIKLGQGEIIALDLSRVENPPQIDEHVYLELKNPHLHIISEISNEHS